MKESRHKAFALLGTGHAVTDVNQGALSVILALLQPVFALSQTQVGLAMLAFNLSSSVIQPLFGIFSDRFNAAWLIPLGCLVAGLGMGLTGFTPNYTVLLFLVLISGLGVAAYHPEGSKFARFASGNRKATGMSFYSVGGNIGFGIGPILVAFLYGLAGLKGTAGLIILGGMMSFILLVNLRTITGTPGGSLLIKSGGEHSVNTVNRINSRVILSLLLLIIIVIMRSWTHLGLVTFIPQYYMHHLHCDKVYVASLTSIFLLAGALGTLFGGPAADRWGLKTIIISSMASIIPLLYLLTHAQGIWIPVVMALTGFAVVSTFAITVVMGQELLPNNVGLASGLMLGFGIGMGGIGTTVMGWVADSWGLPAVFHIMMIFPAIGLVLSLLLPGRKELAKGRDA